MAIKEKCIEIIKSKIIKLSDRASSHCYFINDDQTEVSKIIVDGCAITNGVRCDFLLKSNKFKENFIELKGGDVPHAIDQIVNSINILSDDPKNAPKRCFVISTSNPLSSTQTQMNKLKFRKAFNAFLVFARPGEKFPI